MNTTYDKGDWQWPEDLPGRWTDDGDHIETERKRQSPGDEDPPPVPNYSSQHNTTGAASGQSRAQEEKSYPSRTCRICLETVLPTFETPTEGIWGIFSGTPSVIYSSPDGGRLMRPCLCKGSQKYVHEGCLAAWRLQDPNRKRNYFQCPTCKYNYRLERMTWGRWISGTSAQIALTLIIFLLTTFLLGYVADPIINLYIDPYDTITSPSAATDPIFTFYDDEPETWTEHFFKGLASLGVLGFAKYVLSLPFWHWTNLRTGGGGGRLGATGRDRAAQVSSWVIMVGVATFLFAVWKGVRAWSRRTLEIASERVVDVPIPDDGDQD